MDGVSRPQLHRDVGEDCTALLEHYTCPIEMRSSRRILA